MMKQLSLGVAALCCASAGEAATLFAFDDTNNLVSFDSSNPGAYMSSVQVTGLDGDLLGIDFRPLNNMLYGYSSSYTLFSIDLGTGAATAIGGSNPVLGSTFGFDFNGTIDRIRLVSNTGTNSVLNPNDGSFSAATPVFYASGDANEGQSPTITGSAYTPANPPGTSPMAPGGPTQLYGLDTNLDVLVRQANSAGTLNTVGAFGTDIGPRTGFDIDNGGVGYVLNVHDLYSVNLDTGNLSFIGRTPTALFGLAAAPSPVPEPSTWAFMIIGFGAIGYTLRRRRAQHMLPQAV